MRSFACAASSPEKFHGTSWSISTSTGIQVTARLSLKYTRVVWEENYFILPPFDAELEEKEEQEASAAAAAAAAAITHTSHVVMTGDDWPDNTYDVSVRSRCNSFEFSMNEAVCTATCRMWVVRSHEVRNLFGV